MECLIDVPEYLNKTDEKSIIHDTRLFLREIIGIYLEIIIINNKPKYELFINQKYLENNALSDNARCYSANSVPNQIFERSIWQAIDGLCESYKINDIILFINLGDFPIIPKDKNKHPQYDKYNKVSKYPEYNGSYSYLYPKKLSPIYSRSIIPNEFDDILFPTRDYISLVLSDISSIKTNDFIKKIPKAIFRGSWTGNDRTINNARIKAKILSLQYPSYLDVAITETFDYYMFTKHGAIHTFLDCPEIYNPKLTPEISQEEQFGNYQFILHIDGFVAAWRLARELLSNCVILKVDSNWVEHYYNDLIPYYHYIPIAEDMSDLIQKINWCRENYDKCIAIAKNAYDYAIQNFTKKNLYEYIYKIITEPNCDAIQIKKEYEVTNIDVVQLVQLVQSVQIYPEVDYKCKPVYKEYILPQNRTIEMLPKIKLIDSLAINDGGILCCGNCQICVFPDLVNENTKIDEQPNKLFIEIMQKIGNSFCRKYNETKEIKKVIISTEQKVSEQFIIIFPYLNTGEQINNSHIYVTLWNGVTKKIIMRPGHIIVVQPLCGIYINEPIEYNYVAYQINFERVKPTIDLCKLKQKYKYNHCSSKTDCYIKLCEGYEIVSYWYTVNEKSFEESEWMTLCDFIGDFTNNITEIKTPFFTYNCKEECVPIRDLYSRSENCPIEMCINKTITNEMGFNKYLLCSKLKESVLY